MLVPLIMRNQAGNIKQHRPVGNLDRHSAFLRG